VAPRHPTYDAGIKPRSLKHDVCGRVIDLRMPSTHRAGEAQRATIIANDEILFVECANNVVQRFECLGCTSPTGANGTRNLCLIKRMQRLPYFKHYVVRHIDRE
jgi:hypothetical protein